MPLVVVSVTQLATAVTFIALGWIANARGAHAQAAAEAEVAHQGLPDDLLARGNINFRENLVELSLPIFIAVVLSALAVLNLTGNPTGRVATWGFQCVLLIVGGFIRGQQVFVVRFVRSAFEKLEDEELERVDVERLMEAATRSFPRWFRPVIAARFVLVTVGSLVVMLLLALPSTGAHYE